MYPLDHPPTNSEQQPASSPERLKDAISLAIQTFHKKEKELLNQGKEGQYVVIKGDQILEINPEESVLIEKYAGEKVIIGKIIPKQREESVSKVYNMPPRLFLMNDHEEK